MDYPLFLVPHIGGGWLIGIVAILHVIISHFAVGGGLLTVATEQVANASRVFLPRGRRCEICLG
jgi:cytochrome d ubiquinol oxidase subunit I